jgi:hypothetical protein
MSSHTPCSWNLTTCGQVHTIMRHSCKTQERSFLFFQWGRRWSKIAWTCTVCAIQQTGIYSYMLLLLLHHCHQWPASTAEVWIQIKSITKLLKAELNVNREYTYLQIAWPQICWDVRSIACCWHQNLASLPWTWRSQLMMSKARKSRN